MKNILLFVWLLTVASCSNDGQIGPAEIRYGQDMCAGCSMIISEKQYSAQYILSDGSIKKFDDIGCMIEHIKKTKDEPGKVSATFVRDYKTNNWINVNNAHFFKSDKISTPMGHGIISFSSEEDLKEAQSKTGGTNLGKFDEAVKYF
ncbi:MAG: hypothetical protein GWO07_00890 [Candidatus Dadabacteria bacterium]|nr:hypothetical protein [Candidatus Dadabacteria bacterium]NIS07333.1 hypothetical protein [Candidatus Dadabacteria bacterium]NIV41277.1 hypothetical protein [Candidatus Dadabacteria bacterium]NIX14512.1 hypothetical protein [Candidatus Dadabacteria bacterium]NIY20970.1 hypothetical protein [Candidatus Dadabacteria bacterium]